MENRLPIVAIVGLPNAGKSTFFNKIVGGQVAVTSEVAGTTRDRQYAEVPWNGSTFNMTDTAGLAFFGDQNELERSVKKQIDIATKEADVLVLLVDGKAGADTMDRSVLLAFRKIKKPVVLAINKLDSPNNLASLTAPFYKLGIKAVFAISSVTGRGIGDLLDHVVSILPPLGEGGPVAGPDEGPFHASRLTPHASIAVAIVGKPNVGKSSIFNQILDDERVVVSEVPGTTRTAIDSKITIAGDEYTFIDTAGLKKKEHRQARPDIYSGFQTYKSIRRSDVCLFVIDASLPVTSQDQAIAAEIIDQEKGCIILATKIDAYLKDTKRKGTAGAGKKSKDSTITESEVATLQAYISHHFPFLWMCPVYFVSGLTGEGITDALKNIKPIYERRHKEVSQEDLDALFKKWMKIAPPKRLLDQKEPKAYGLKQIAVDPPKFEILVNHTPAIQETFRKTIENAIIKDLDFWGTPIKVHKVKKV